MTTNVLLTNTGLRLDIGGGQLVAEYRVGEPPPPAARTFVASQTGLSSNEGTAGSPWTMEHALTQAVPGDTIQMRGGRWRTTAGWNLNASGIEGDPVTVTRYPGETPIIDGSLAGPVDSPTTSWEVFDAVRGIYRSTFTVPATTGYYAGHIALGTADDYDDWYALIPYKLYSYLAADTHLWSATNPYYVGPGVFYDSATNKLFVRLVTPTSESQCGRSITPIPDTDARNNILHLSRSGYYAFNVRANYNHVVDVGIIQSFFGCYRVIDSVASPVEGFEANDNEGHPTYFVLRAGYSDGTKMLGGNYNGHMSFEDYWVSWVDAKAGVLAAQNVRKAAVDLGYCTNFEFGPSPGSGSTVWFPESDGADPLVFNGFFDGILGNGTGSVGALASVHGVHFIDIMDDAWQRTGNVYRSNMYDFLCEGAGPSRDGTGTATPNPMPGTVYIHHGRVIGKRAFWYRKGHPTDVAGTGWRETPGLSTHGVPGVGKHTVPAKIWNLDILVGVSGETRSTIYGGGFGRFGTVDATSEASDERYNNLLYYIDGGYLGRDAFANTADEIYDGNLYWGWNGTAPIWLNLYTSAGVGSVNSLSALRTAALTDSVAYYAPGWENAGVAINPNMDINWNPQAAIHTGAVDIEAIHPTWPGVTGYIPHRGASAA